MNLAINNKEKLIGNVGAKKPLRSCLKRSLPIDFTNPFVVKRRKNVTFNLDPQEKMSNELFQQLANAGDVTRRAYSRILQVLTSTDKLRVLVSYQPGVTLDYIRYMFKCPWDRKFNDETGLIHWQILDPTSIDSAEDSLCVYVVWRPDHKQCRNISNHFSHFKNAVALVLGDVNLMVKLGNNMRFNGLLPGFDKPLTFLVTQHDLEREGHYFQESSKHRSILNATGGIPVLIDGWEKAEGHHEYLWIRDSKIFGRLFILMMMNQPIDPHWRELKTGLSMLDLASACGFTFSTRSGDVLNCSGLANSNASLAGSVLILCEKLKDLCCSLHDKIDEIMHAPGVAWQVMENAVVQNLQIVDRLLPHQPYKKKFPFLATSFVADKVHQVYSSLIGPKVTAAAKVSSGKRHRYQFNLAIQIHPEDWPFYLASAPIDIVIQPRESSASPDAYIILEEKVVVDDVARLDRNLLCFQVKYGAQDLPLSKVLDELAKCPQVRVKLRARGIRLLAYDKKFIADWSSPIEYKLTFVYAAMSHDKAVKTLLKDKTCDEIHDSYIRCTHKSFPSIPEDIELIVLRQPGLIQLLGRDLYSHLKSFKPAAVSSSLLSAYDNPVATFLQCRDSNDPQAVLDEVTHIFHYYTNFVVDTSGTKLTHRTSATSSDLALDDANVSPIVSQGSSLPNKLSPDKTIAKEESHKDEAQPTNVLPVKTPVVRNTVAGSGRIPVKPKLTPVKPKQAPVKITTPAPSNKYDTIKPRYLLPSNKYKPSETKEKQAKNTKANNTNRGNINNAPM